MFKLSPKSVVPVIKLGAKVALPTGMGFLFARVGSEVARAVSPRIAAFAARSPTNEGIVRFFIGVPLSIIMAMLLGRKNAGAVIKLAALGIAGTIPAAVQPVLQPHIESAANKLKSLLSRGASTTPQLPAPGVPAVSGWNYPLQLSGRAGGLSTNPFQQLTGTRGSGSL